jgi:hypothetical protein
MTTPANPETDWWLVYYMSLNYQILINTNQSNYIVTFPELPAIPPILDWRWEALPEKIIEAKLCTLPSPRHPTRFQDIVRVPYSANLSTSFN